jgi:hypothetical protein
VPWKGSGLQNRYLVTAVAYLIIHCTCLVTCLYSTIIIPNAHSWNDTFLQTKKTRIKKLVIYYDDFMDVRSRRSVFRNYL